MSSTRLTNVLKGIRFRLTLVYSTLFGLFICAFAYIISNQYFQSGREEFDSGLLNYAIDLSEYLRIDDSGLKINFELPHSEIKKAFPFILTKTIYFVRAFDGTILTRSEGPLPFSDIPFDLSLPSREDYTHRFLTFAAGNDTFRAVNIKITNDAGKQMVLQVATSVDTLVERERNHLLVIILMVPSLILISSFISYLIAGNALAPIKVLTDTANTIAARNLSLRVPVARTGDEVEELSKTLNTLLERLEKSFKAQENFVSNASHQLNTPLAIIKGELEVLQSKERTLDDHNRFLKSLREELERLIELVKNMLLVSRVESGLDTFVFHPIRLDDLLLSTSSRMGVKAREKKIIIRFNIDEDLHLEVMGEKQLLDSLFENILDNAIKYSPEGSTIQIEIKKVDGKIEVRIQDEGPGIEEKDIKNILSVRFHRASPIGIAGTGIGLPIAQKIAQFHEAQIEYKKVAPCGSLFIIRFNALQNQETSSNQF